MAATSSTTRSSSLFVCNPVLLPALLFLTASAIDYRGHWCPFCVAYLKTLEKLTPSITAAGGKVIAVTAETADHLQETRDATGYTGEVIVDPQNLVAAEMRQRGKVDVAISEKKGYAHGMAQPAVLVTQSDGTVLYSWAIVPSVVSISGELEI
jgi:peroxiredoxin